MADLLSTAAQNRALDAVVAVEMDRARLFAREVHELVALGGLSASEQDYGEVVQFAQLELAGSCRLGQGTATIRLLQAERLVVVALPLTLRALEQGALFVHQAKVMLERTANCTEQIAREVERRVLPAGLGACPADLGRQVAKTVLLVEAELDAQAALERRDTARRSRRTWTRPELDGMGVAGALLTAHTAGHLDGYGPLSAEHVRMLLPHASLRRIAVDTHTGRPIWIDPTTHPACPDPGAAHPAAQPAASGRDGRPGRTPARPVRRAAPAGRPPGPPLRRPRLRRHHPTHRT